MNCRYHTQPTINVLCRTEYAFDGGSVAKHISLGMKVTELCTCKGQTALLKLYTVKIHYV